MSWKSSDTEITLGCLLLGMFMFICICVSALFSYITGFKPNDFKESVLLGFLLILGISILLNIVYQYMHIKYDEIFNKRHIVKIYKDSISLSSEYMKEYLLIVDKYRMITDTMNRMEGGQLEYLSFIKNSPNTNIISTIDLIEISDIFIMTNDKNKTYEAVIQTDWYKNLNQDKKVRIKPENIVDIIQEHYSIRKNSWRSKIEY